MQAARTSCLSILAREGIRMAVLGQKLVVAHADDVQIASASAVAARRTAHRDEFFTAPAHNAVAALSGLAVEIKFVYKCHIYGAYSILPFFANYIDVFG